MLLVVLGTVVTFHAVAALWINRQVMDTDNWASASSQMLKDPKIRTALSGYLVDQLYSNVDVPGEIRAALPPRAAPLAAPAAGAVRDLAEKVANELLQRPRVQALWESANRTAHESFLKVVKGGGPAISTQNGVVTLDVAGVLQQLEERTGVGGKLAAKIGPGNAKITVLRSNQLSFAQDVANALRPLAIILVLLALALYGGAVALARGRRRETVRAVGFGFVIAGALALLLRSAGGNAVGNALASTDAARPAVDSVWRIGTSLLSEAATATIGYGVVIVLAAWLAGPTRAAVSCRRALAPFLHDPFYAWGGAAVLAIIVLLWGPTPGTRHFVPALILIGLFALGVEALRRQTTREFPGSTRPELGEVVRRGIQRIGAVPGNARHGGNGRTPHNGDAPRAAEPDPLAQLERLADLHDRGALSDTEFADQKTELLTPH